MSTTYWFVHNNGMGEEIEDVVFDDPIEIEMFSVGKGEAIVISRGSDAILIDGGSARKSALKAKALAGYLSGRNQLLRAIIASHPHRDHSNFHKHIVKENIFANGAVYYDNASDPAQDKWNILEKAISPLPVSRIRVGHNKNLDGNLRIKGLGSRMATYMLRSTVASRKKRGTIETPEERAKREERNRDKSKYWSVFLLLRYRNVWMLFTGDAYIKYEDKLLPRLKKLSKHIHLLKVTHHGSGEGTSSTLVNSLNPAVAIVSNDKAGSHDLDPKVRKRLSQVDAKNAIYGTYDADRARKVQDIVVRTDGEIYELDDTDGSVGIVLEVTTRDPVLP